MMIKTTTLNEVLYRFDDTGAFKGCCVRTLTRVVDDVTGEVFSAREDPAMTLEQAKTAGIDVPGALNDALSAALAQTLADAPEAEQTEPTSLWTRITSFFKPK